MSLQAKKNLGQYALELDLVCQEIDANDGIVTDDMLVRFDSATVDLATKVDGWLWYLDTIKAMIEALKERKDRAAKAHKAAENLQKRLKEHVKWTIQQTPDIPFKGNEGSIYLHRNPPGIELSFTLEDKSIYKTVPDALMQIEPSIGEYTKEITVKVLDMERLRNDLKAGKFVAWAEIKQDSHVRTKG